MSADRINPQFITKVENGPTNCRMANYEHFFHGHHNSQAVPFEVRYTVQKIHNFKSPFS